jgi:hypothetical protein
VFDKKYKVCHNLNWSAGSKKWPLLELVAARKTRWQLISYEGEKKITHQEHQIRELKEKFYGEREFGTTG